MNFWNRINKLGWREYYLRRVINPTWTTYISKWYSFAPSPHPKKKKLIVIILIVNLRALKHYSSPPPPPPQKKFESLFVRPNKNFKILTCTIENYALACHEIETTTLILLLKKSHFSSKKKKNKNHRLYGLHFNTQLFN